MANGALLTPGQQGSSDSEDEGAYKQPIHPDIGRAGSVKADTHNFNLPSEAEMAKRASDDSEKVGLYNQSGDSAPDSAASLKNKEELGDDDKVGEGYNDDEVSKPTRRRSRFGFTRRRAAIAGVGTTAVVGGLFAFFSISSGPLEFIHIAQLLEKFHFSAQEDGEDSRLMRIARFINDPSKPENMRLGVIGNAVANKLTAKIHDATGLTPIYENGFFQGYEVDPEHELFKDKTPQEIINELVNTYGIDESQVTISPQINGPDKISFNPSTGYGINTAKEYLVQTGFTRDLFGRAGLSKVSAWASARVLTKRAGWSFHPITALDSAIQEAAIKGGKKALEKLKEQFASDQTAEVEGTATPDVPDGTPQAESQTGANGQPEPPASQAIANEQAVKNIQANPSESNITDSLESGGAGLIGAACILRNIDGSIVKLREAKVILPMMRFAGQIISVGSQAMTGQDITALQLGFFKDYLDGKDSSGKVTSTWDQARSVQAELGEPLSGPDIPKQGQVFTKKTPFSFLNGLPGINTACGIFGGTLGTIFSIVTGPINFLVSSQLIGDASGFLSDWLSGKPINPFTPASAGAADGNYMNYGARASASDQYASAGGVPLSSSDESSLKQTSLVLDNKEFQTKSLAYRLFNPNDSQTLISKLMDNYGTIGVTTGFADIVHNFGSIFSAVLKVPATLFTGLASADNQPYDYHGLQEAGFSAADLTNPLFDNAFDNACYVGGNCKLSNGTFIPYGENILGDPNSQNTGIINKVQTCFGDNITFDGSMWNIDYGSAPVDFYSDAYASADCTSQDTDWMRVRFWILDTQTIEGYDCSQGETSTSDASCQDLGFGSTGPTSSSTAPGCDGSSGKYSALVSAGASFAGTDQGIDFVPSNSSGFDICAPASGVITQADATGHLFYRTPGQAEIIEKLDQTPSASSSSQYIYYAEIININSNIKVGVHVNAGDLIGHNDQSPGIEVGWGLSPTVGFMCPLGPQLGSATPCGQSFNTWVQSVSSGQGP